MSAARDKQRAGTAHSTPDAHGSASIIGSAEPICQKSHNHPTRSTHATARVPIVAAPHACCSWHQGSTSTRRTRWKSRWPRHSSRRKRNGWTTSSNSRRRSAHDPANDNPKRPRAATPQDEHSLSTLVADDRRAAVAGASAPLSAAVADAAI